MAFESESRWSHHRYVRARRPTLRQEGASSEQEENSRGIEDNRFTFASGKLSLGLIGYATLPVIGLNR